MKILVIGTGLLGSNLMSLSLSRGIDIVGTYYETRPAPNRSGIYRLDKSDWVAVKSLFREHIPDVVVDTAAMHNVDECEKFQEKSRKINVIGTQNVARACKENNAKMVFISTDYVFDGKRSDYRENDTPNPLNTYARHKLEAEKIVFNTSRDFLVCRTSVLYGVGGSKKNFATWLLSELKMNHKVNIVDDQYSNPTLANDLTHMILDLCEKNENGIFHTTGSQCVNRYEFSKIIADSFSLDSRLINPVKTEQLGQRALRPKNCCINTDKITKIIGRKPLSCIEGINKMKKEMDLK